MGLAGRRICGAPSRATRTPLRPWPDDSPEFKVNFWRPAAKDAGFFAPSMPGRFVEEALNATGDVFLSSLLFTEARLVRDATDALEHAGIRSIGDCGDGTHAGDQDTRQVCSRPHRHVQPTRQHGLFWCVGWSGRILLVESSGALGSLGAKPAAMLTLYALKPGHTFNLGTFIDRKVPPQTEVSLTQTLVSLK